MMKKGQAGAQIIPAMIILMIVGFLGIVSITIFDSIETSMTSAASTTAADQVIANYTENFYDAEDLASNIPIVLAAGVLLTVIIGFSLYLRG